jgi:PadR family transcriptional regulator PadR
MVMPSIDRTLDRELKKGSAELMVLSIIGNGSRHGYEIAGERRRRFYSLTAEGRRELARQRSAWKSFVRSMSLVTGVEHA